MKLKRVAKPLFATNYTDFREVEKKSAQISEISGKDFEVLGMVATWVILNAVTNCGISRRAKALPQFVEALRASRL